MYLSVVVPVYNEYENIPLLYDEVVKALKDINDWELILVNDGSKDNSLEALKDLAAKDTRHVKVIGLRRNFGQTAAIAAGIDHASGEIIERKGTFYLKNSEQLVGGWAKVYRKNWKYPTYCSVSFDEVANRKKDGSLNSNWAGKGATMVEKVAKVRALRETFIEDLQGMYDADEMNAPTPEAPAAPSEPVIVNQEEPTDTQPIDVSFDEL